MTEKADRLPPSRLHSGQKRLLALVVALGVVMLADTLYLLAVRLAGALDIERLAVTGVALPKVYQTLLLSHTGIGLVLVLVALAFVEWHLPAVWRRSRAQAIVTGVVTAVLGLGLAVTGLFILSEANSRDNAWAWWCHVIAAAALPGFYVAHGTGGGAPAYTAAARSAFEAGSNRGAGSPMRDLAVLAGTDFVPASFVPYQSPFFSRRRRRGSGACSTTRP